MVKDRTVKRGIGSIMRKKLSDITNSHQLQGQPTKQQEEEEEEEEKPLDTSSSLDKDLCIQQLLKERATLLKLLAEKHKMVAWSGAEMQMLRSNVQKLQLQNWNLAQSNTHMLAELNLGKERIKALQHELLWRAALLKGHNTEGKLDTNYDDMKGSLSRPKDGDVKTGKPSPKSSSNHKQSNIISRRRCSIRRRSTASSPSNSSTKNAQKDKAENKRGACLRRQSCGTKFERREGEVALENLFEIEDANYDLVIQPRPNKPKHEAGNTSCSSSSSSSRNETPKSSSFRILLGKSVDKAQQPHKDTTNASESQLCGWTARPSKTN